MEYSRDAGPDIECVAVSCFASVLLIHSFGTPFVFKPINIHMSQTHPTSCRIHISMHLTELSFLFFSTSHGKFDSKNPEHHSEERNC